MLPLLVKRITQWLEGALPICFHGVDEAWRERPDSLRHRPPLEERFTACPAHVPRTGRRHVAHPMHDIVHTLLRILPAFDRVHGVTPDAPQVARVQADEDRRIADEGALPPDRLFSLRDAELFPGPGLARLPPPSG